MSSILHRTKNRVSIWLCVQIRRLSQQTSKRSNRIVVDTPSGKLQGTLQRSCLGDDYYSFKGIPYAEPPIGQLRFQDPRPIEAWPDIRDATSHSSVSCQYDYAKKEIVGSEDCLYLNVYTPSLKSSSPRSVMVWFHGGAFTTMNSNDDYHGPDFLIHKDVVLVTFNYRLGMFGFLNLEHELAMGNQGLKDQLLLLKWVKRHIASFGGDPKNVTVFGFSAGAVSIQYLEMSPVSKGLFDRAICQSGAITCSWATRNNPRQRLYKALALLGYHERQPDRILNYLRTVDACKLIEVQQILCSTMRWVQNNLPFGPTFNDNFDDPALPGITSKAAVQRGVRVPLILGSNSNEGIFYHDYLKYHDLNDVDRNLVNYLHPRIVRTLEFHGMTVDDLKRLYFDGQKICHSNMDKVIKMWGDLYISNDIRHLARFQLANASDAVPTYYYKFSYDKNLTLYKKQRRTTFKGANHGEEFTYLFRMNVCDHLGFEQLQQNTGADRMMRRMIDMWTNFAKTGKPIPAKTELLPVDWQPLTKDSPVDCLDIDEELTATKTLQVDELFPGGTRF